MTLRRINPVTSRTFYMKNQKKNKLKFKTIVMFKPVKS